MRTATDSEGPSGSRTTRHTPRNYEALVIASGHGFQFAPVVVKISDEPHQS